MFSSETFNYFRRVWVLLGFPSFSGASFGIHVSLLSRSTNSFQPHSRIQRWNRPQPRFLRIRQPNCRIDALNKVPNLYFLSLLFKFKRSCQPFSLFLLRQRLHSRSGEAQIKPFPNNPFTRNDFYSYT